MHTFTRVLFLALAAVLWLSSCSHRRTAEDSKRKAAPDIPDTTVYARIDAVEGDSVDITLTGQDRTLRLKVPGDGSVAGGMNVGDTLALTMEGRRLLSSVNVSQIVGLWLVDGTDGDAIRLAPDGGASWIGTAKDVTLRSWYIRNGMLVISHIKADGSDYRERPDTVEISRLDEDGMVMAFGGSRLSLTRSKGLITRQ